MSRSKRGSVTDNLYTQHLNGPFRNSPSLNRIGTLERMYMRVLTELAANRFKWSNLPKSVDPRFLELTLFYNAISVFYFDTDYDMYFALKGGSANWVNMMDNPTAFRVVGNNFVGKTIKAKDAVPIWANYLRMPDLDIVNIYATKFANLDRTIEINAENARRSKFIVSNENQKLSLQNINRMMDSGDNGIQIGGPVQDMEFVTTVDLGIDPNTIEKLHIVRGRLWNECMSLLGINNSNQDKKERLVSAEVGANDDQISMMRYVNLNARRQAVTAINSKWDLNISVEFQSDDEMQNSSNELEGNY